MLATIMRRGRTWPWIRMRPFLARFSEPVWSGHLPSWADFITTTPVFRFSVHTDRRLLDAGVPDPRRGRFRVDCRERRAHQECPRAQDRRERRDLDRRPVGLWA